MKHEKIQIQYILPNIFTAASCFMGIISIFASSRGDFEKAAIYIVFSLILDTLDGRVARLTNTQSKFGAEFDSLADVVAFGVAPTVLFFYAIGFEYSKFGALVAALYVVFGAIRLARFNIANAEPSVFIGIPIPTAAVVSMSWTLLFIEYDFLQKLTFLVVIIHAVIGLLMVSNIRYPSFKKVDFKKTNIFKIFILLIFLLSLLYIIPIESAAIISSAYVFYGILRVIYNIYIAKKKKNRYNQ